jgi:seryl-tRNA synthetase
MISIIENFQQPDGSIAIPEPLQPFMGASVITS